MKRTIFLTVALLCVVRYSLAAVVAPPAAGSNRDVLVLTDLHIGTSGGYGIEDFYYDEDLTSLLAHQLKKQKKTGRGQTLVLAGDTFEFRKTAHSPKGHPVGSAEAARLHVRKIAASHPKVFQAFSHFLDAGNSIVIVAGNHDTDTNHHAVQAEFRRILATQMRVKKKPDVTFSPWFYLIGNALIEHGQRYEATNSVDHMLCHADVDGVLREAESDLIVKELVTPLMKKHGRLLCQKMRPRKLWGLFRALPSALVDLFRFSHRLHRQIPAITDAKDASLRAKQKEKIREIVQKGDFLENFNTLRVAMGQRQLTAMQAYLQLVAFNNLATTSTLRDTKSRTFLHFLWKRFRHWRDPSVEGSIQRAEAFVLRHFPTDVFVAGHTHLPHHRQTQSPSGRQKHSLNPGSWSELPRSAKPKKSTGLHYVELRMNDGRATPALSRWRTPVRAAKHKPISSK